MIIKWTREMQTSFGLCYANCVNSPCSAFLLPSHKTHKWNAHLNLLVIPQSCIENTKEKKFDTRKAKLISVSVIVFSFLSKLRPRTHNFCMLSVVVTIFPLLYCSSFRFRRMPRCRKCYSHVLFLSIGFFEMVFCRCTFRRNRRSTQITRRGRRGRQRKKEERERERDK